MMNPADCPADKWYLMEDEEGTVFAGRHCCSSLDGTWTLVSEHGESWLSSNSEIRVIAELVSKDEADAELAEANDRGRRWQYSAERRRDWTPPFDPSDPDALERLADNLEAVEHPIPRKSMTVVHLRRNAAALRERAARDEQRDKEIAAVMAVGCAGYINHETKDQAARIIDALDAVRKEAK